MHIHIRTSVPGIEKALPLDFFFVFGILSRILPIRAAEFAAHAHSRIQGEILGEGGGGGVSVAPGGRRTERERERASERRAEKKGRMKGMEGLEGSRIDERFEKRSGKIP